MSATEARTLLETAEELRENAKYHLRVAEYLRCDSESTVRVDCCGIAFEFDNAELLVTVGRKLKELAVELDAEADRLEARVVVTDE